MDKTTALRLASRLNLVHDMIQTANTEQTDDNVLTALKELELSCRMLASEIDSINSYLKGIAQP